MLPKEKRLSREDFQEMNGKRRKFDSPLFFLTVTYTSTTKAAMIVAKKVAPKAVQRNALRRTLYRSIEAFLPRFSQTAYVVVKAKPKVAKVSEEEIRGELERVLTEANLL